MPRAVLTGAAGFLGSHLADRLLREGWEVLGLDSLLTGNPDNLADAQTHENFQLQEFDVTNYIEVEGHVDWVMHFASPASPIDYLEHPIHTLKVGALGTLHSLGLAKAKGASFYLSSTSETYGDPLVHPQPESYWGNVNPVGPRGVYDEAKRYAEAMTMAYHRAHGIDVRIIRIFNTFGPRMRRKDGRAVPTFIDQSLRGEALTVHGDGSQTRSLGYVDDLVEGIFRFLGVDHTGPLNLGNPEEVTILHLAKSIATIAGVDVDTVFVERPVDDPEVRCPDISLAKELLGWEPQVSLQDGLARTIEWARAKWL
ncbi:MAG: dTDP-glucose 4,6-dehydratase [Actinomycetota bacterium]|jgi:dTDP-glucose 4,6-dehydratase|nr:dTDP-glucose 4,6-dehydratase [Actinomycetota bacterium]